MTYPLRDMSGMTEFFREPSFVPACSELIPDLYQRLGRVVQIAEVGCSSGEETWSLAALLKTAGVEFHIDAIDRCRFSLEGARQGVYDFAHYTLIENSIKNNVPDGCLDHFPGIRTDALNIPVRPSQDLQNHVSFAEGDVAWDPLPENAYDVVTACNFLYYYDTDGIRVLMGNMLNGLRGGGYFIRDDGQCKEPGWLELARDLRLEPISKARGWPSGIYQYNTGPLTQ